MVPVLLMVRLDVTDFLTMSAQGVRRGKAALFQWVQVPPGHRSSRSNRSSHGGDEMAEAFGIACHELVSLDFRFGSKAAVYASPSACPAPRVKQTK